MSKAHHSRFLGKDDVFPVRTLDGSDTLYSRAFSASYHSINGAVSESRHVFIQHGLSKLLHLPSISILEVGFGTGLNAFLTFLFSQKQAKLISYTGIEPFPIDPKVAEQLNYPSYLAADEFSELFLKMHREDSFETPNFNFQKLHSLDELPSSGGYDCIFFDAFSPDEHEELWEQNIFDRIQELTSSGGYLVTYCAQGEVRRKLERANYVVNRLPGAPGKRQMIQAIKK